NGNGAGNPPYANRGTALATSAKLRQAFEEALDRNLMDKTFSSGIPQFSCTPIPPSNTAWYAAAKVPCTPYDPKHAKQLVAESGISNPTVHLLVTSTTELLSRAEFVQQQEKAIGINVVIDTFDNTTTTTKANRGEFDAYLTSFGPGLPDPSFVLNAGFK